MLGMDLFDDDLVKLMLLATARDDDGAMRQRLRMREHHEQEQQERRRDSESHNKVVTELWARVHHAAEMFKRVQAADAVPDDEIREWLARANTHPSYP